MIIMVQRCVYKLTALTRHSCTVHSSQLLQLYCLVRYTAVYTMVAALSCYSGRAAAAETSPCGADLAAGISLNSN